MTNTLTISRELAERVFNLGWFGDGAAEAEEELRALLAAPAVERQEPVAIVMEETHNYMGYLVFSGEGSRLEQPRPVVEKKAVLLDREIPAGTKLYTSPPMPVAAINPELGSTPEDHMRWLLDKVVNPGDYPQSVLHDQIRSTLACLDKVKEMNR